MNRCSARKHESTSHKASFICCRLSICVNEALWRLQLFTDTDFMQKIGHISMPGHISAVCDTQDDWLYQSEASESEDEKEAEVPAAQKPAGKRLKPEAEKSSESGSQSARSGGWYWSQCLVLVAVVGTGRSVWYWWQCLVLVEVFGTGSSVWYWSQSLVLVAVFGTGRSVWYWLQCWVLVAVVGTGSSVWYWSQCLVLVAVFGTGRSGWYW